MVSGTVVAVWVVVVLWVVVVGVVSVVAAGEAEVVPGVVCVAVPEERVVSETKTAAGGSVSAGTFPQEENNMSKTVAATPEINFRLFIQ